MNGLRSAWWILSLSTVCIYLIIAVSPMGLDVLSQLQDAWLQFHRESSHVEATASHRLLTLCHLSFWGLLDQISSHGGSRVPTGQAPVQKNLLSLCLSHFAHVPLAKIATTKLSQHGKGTQKGMDAKGHKSNILQLNFRTVLITNAFGFQCAFIIYWLYVIFYLHDFKIY